VFYVRICTANNNYCYYFTCYRWDVHAFELNLSITYFELRIGVFASLQSS
jgi:hypothetical protein